MPPTYVIGIDLGTTNCVLSYADLSSDQVEINVLSIPQMTAPATVESRSSLPSFLYCPTEEEQTQGVFQLPWEKSAGGAEKPAVVGELARKNSAELAERVIGAAKSWLSYQQVDRNSQFLPLQSEPDQPKWSPVEASQAYLAHLAATWNHEFPNAPFREQSIVITVPASFDASARDLTLQAAKSLGLEVEPTLLEEPQAALYAWIEQAGEDWRRDLEAGSKVIVCDVGGGTTDLSLIEVVEESGQLEFHRQAVGNHLLVGGDNMDLSLAHIASQQFSDKGVELDPWQAISLWHSCRDAKETLLAEGKTQKIPISIKKKGRRLIGGTATVNLLREEVQNHLMDGFFPHCKFDERPQELEPIGFQELGLPYEADTAITRHLAAFLSDHLQSPDDLQSCRVLFNGGVFKSPPFRDRIIETLNGWSAGDSITSLDPNANLDHSVSRGAAFYGWSKSQGGVRIRGGAAHAYYVGIQTTGLAIPGAPRPIKAVCVVPIGMEEGTECEVPNCEVGMVVGKPARFRFFKSSVRREDEPGKQLNRWTDEELVESASLEATLESNVPLDDPYLAIRFVSRVTELGIFELWCHAPTTGQQWKLEFSIREQTG